MTRAEYFPTSFDADRGGQKAGLAAFRRPLTPDKLDINGNHGFALIGEEKNYCAGYAGRGQSRNAQHGITLPFVGRQNFDARRSDIDH